MIQKIGRNDPCSCHSGLKYKKCCGKAAPFDEDGYTYAGHIALTDANEPEVGAREGFIIVKVQTALDDPTSAALIYDRGRTFKRFVDVEQVSERMAGRIKAFFYAKLSFGQLVLGDEAPEQRW
jgi:hypothetical protein